jgi:GNAT superfamily N-acetyltransferase
MAMTVRQLSPSDPDYLAALHLALDATPAKTGKSARPVQELLDATNRAGAALDLVFSAYNRRRMESAVVAFSGGGSAAIVYVPQSHVTKRAAQGMRACALALYDVTAERGIKLLEVLVDSTAEDVARALEGCGFRYLTRLTYMNRSIPGPPFDSEYACDLQWDCYAPERDGLFLRALEATYTESLDCPELTGIRTTEEVLAGHRATGVFDPANWWVVRQGDEPAGVLLLCGVPRQAALEIVYLGVAQTVRGKGFGDALVHRAVDTCRAIGAKDLTLAVDGRNRPARVLYQRWHFRPVALRDAWIASSVPA